MNPMFYIYPGKGHKKISITPEGERALKKFILVKKITAAVNIAVSAVIIYAAFTGMI